VAADAHFVETRRLAVSHHRIGEPGGGRRPLLAAQISDLHLQRVGSLPHAIARALGRHRPHLLLFTGDALDRGDRFPALEEFVGLLDPRVPIYGILGNWEYWGGVDRDALQRLYARSGGRLLVNQTAFHAHQGRVLALTGLHDLVGGTPDLREATREDATFHTRLLLEHCPAYRDRIPQAATRVPIGGNLVREGADFRALGVAAVLSGHTHGGQVAVMGYAPLRPPGSGRYNRGWYRDPGLPPMFVSRGIGTSMLPVRLGSVPELALLEVWV
jgi:predicted MPP superfamily phosphohydrolase